jgi:hypothetical protein
MSKFKRGGYLTAKNLNSMDDRTYGTPYLPNGHAYGLRVATTDPRQTPFTYQVRTAGAPPYSIIGVSPTTAHTYKQGIKMRPVLSHIGAGASAMAMFYVGSVGTRPGAFACLQPVMHGLIYRVRVVNADEDDEELYEGQTHEDDEVPVTGDVCGVVPGSGAMSKRYGNFICVAHGAELNVNGDNVDVVDVMHTPGQWFWGNLAEPLVDDQPTKVNTSIGERYGVCPFIGGQSFPSGTGCQVAVEPLTGKYNIFPIGCATSEL